MMQIGFQPALDYLNATFRLLVLRSVVGAGIPKYVDQIRVLDFYFLFPIRISAVRLTVEDRKEFRRISPLLESKRPYAEQPADELLFARMEPVQRLALQILATSNYLVPDKLANQLVEYTDLTLPTDLRARVHAKKTQDAELLGFLGRLARNYTFLGRDGLKGRTGLMDYHYDPI